MKIFLGNSPFYRKDHYGVRAGSRWPHYEKNEFNYMPFPFFLAQSAALIEKKFETLLIDGIAEKKTEKEFINDIKRFEPDIIILEVSTITIDHDIKISKNLKNIFPHSKIIFCGLHNLMYNPNFLEKHEFIDIVLLGEYELTLLEYLTCISNKGDISKVKGIIYKKDNKAFSNGFRKLTDPLEKLPWPARHFLPMYDYHDEPGCIPQPSLQMIASRGCIFGCIFCAWPQIMYRNNSYRTRNIDDILDELEYCIDVYGFKSVYFDDDTFNIGKLRMLEFCKKYKERKINIPWAIMARADLMDEEILNKMADAGLWAVKYGVETADQTLLDNSGKMLNLKKAIKNIKLTKIYGIKTHLTFLFGLPGETPENVDKNINLALELNPDSAQFSIATPFPGSKFYDQLKEKNMLLEKEWKNFDGGATAVISLDTISPDQLEQAVNRAYLKFGLKKSLNNGNYMKFIKGNLYRMISNVF